MVMEGLHTFALGNLAMAPYFVLGPLVVKEELGGPADWGVLMTAAVPSVRNMRRLDAVAAEDAVGTPAPGLR